MGVLPLEFINEESMDTLQLDGTEEISISGLSNDLEPGILLDMEIKRAEGGSFKTQVKLRIDTGIEVEYYRHGGILPYVLRNILAS